MNNPPTKEEAIATLIASDGPWLVITFDGRNANMKSGGDPGLLNLALDRMKQEAMIYAAAKVLASEQGAAQPLTRKRNEQTNRKAK